MNGGLPFETRRTSEGEFVLEFKTPLTYEHSGAIRQALSDPLDK